MPELQFDREDANFFKIFDRVTRFIEVLESWLSLAQVFYYPNSHNLDQTIFFSPVVEKFFIFLMKSSVYGNSLNSYMQ